MSRSNVAASMALQSIIDAVEHAMMVDDLDMRSRLVSGAVLMLTSVDGAKSYEEAGDALENNMRLLFQIVEGENQ